MAVGVGKGIRAASSGLIYEGITWDGSNDYLSRGADLSGNANGKVGSTVLFLNPTTVAAQQRIYRGSTEGLNIIIDTIGRISVVAKNTGGTDIMNLPSVNSAYTIGSRNCIMISWDLTNNTSANRHMYVNDTNVLDTVSTFTNDTIDYTNADHGIGAAHDGSNKYNGDSGPIWISFDEFIDFSDSANRRKFCTSDGRAKNLGSDGSTPTGTSPIIFQALAKNGTLSTFKTNKGSGGGFTETGALTLASEGF